MIVYTSADLKRRYIKHQGDKIATLSSLYPAGKVDVFETILKPIPRKVWAAFQRRESVRRRPCLKRLARY